MWPSDDALFLHHSYSIPEPQPQPFKKGRIAERLMVTLVPPGAGTNSQRARDFEILNAAYTQVMRGRVVIFLNNHTALGRSRFVVQFAPAQDQSATEGWAVILHGLTELLPSCTHHDGMFAVDDDRDKVFLNLLERLD